jgi:hypothetical protein
MKPIALCAAVASIAVLSGRALGSGIPEASADYVRIRYGGPSTRGKLYLSKHRFRSESGIPGGQAALIVDVRSGKAWMLLPPPLGCIMRPINDGMRANMPLLLDKAAKERLVGSEVIDGHPTRKYELISSVGGKPTVRYVWRATDLKGFPIKTTDESGRSTTTFENVVLRKPDAKLFEPPADCKTAASPRGSGRPAPK